MTAAQFEEIVPVSVSQRCLLITCSAYNGCKQYPIQGIPPAIDHALRARARAAGKSLNEAAVDALAEGAGVTSAASRTRRDLGEIAGTWKANRLFRKSSG
jgi:hypothetical protein